MSKRLVIATLAGLLTVAAAAPARAALYQVQVNENTVALTPSPITIGPTVMVPLRGSLGLIGATDINYNRAANQVTFNYQGRQYVVDVQQGTATVAGQQVDLAGPVRMLDGRIWVPAAFISNINPRFGVTRVLGFRGEPGVAAAPIPGDTGISSFTVNGQTFTYESPTWYMGDVLMVPLSETLSALGITPAAFGPGDLQTSFVYGDRIVRINVQSGYAQVGDTAVPMARPAVERGGMLYVPATFIAQLVPGFSIAGMRR